MAAQPRDSERRYATVVFADVSGFTAMSRKLDPEEVTHVMNGCFGLLEEVVRGHGGHVDKYIGDCIMALFGVPTALEHAARQAVNAAIEMRNRLSRFNESQRLAVPLGIHIGINSGLVLAGDVGGAIKRDFTVIGDAVNLASRLKDAAGLGSIYVGAQTFGDTRHDFEYRKLKAPALKGMEKPVTAYELTSVRERIHRPKPVRSDRTISSDVVGRDAELGQVRERVRAVLEGHGGIVNVIGEAGIGKSRLLAEVLSMEETNAATVLEGRALSMGESLSFHLFVDLFRHWAGITDDDAERQALDKLEAAVGALLPEEAGELFPFVATLMGMCLTGQHAERVKGIEGEAMEKLIVKSVRELLQALARTRPLVLVFEDLHWADLSSIKLLLALLPVLREGPILFIHAFRPDHQHTSQRVLNEAQGKFARQHIALHLSQLSAGHCAKLIRNLIKIDERPHTTRSVILRMAEGNPFFIEEVIRSLVDQGAVEETEAGLRVTEKIESVVIPGTIQEVIMARIDRLPEHVRHVLQLASVIGRSFAYRILAAVAQDAEQLEWDLGYLRKRQLLNECRAGGELSYAFTHAIAQETIYESILRKTRKALHLRVATSIEFLFADRLSDYYGMLAYHFGRAESLEKAGEYLFKAGDEAARSAASSEALNYFREASRLYFLVHGEGGDADTKARLEKSIGTALLNKGDLPEALDHFDKALEHYGERVPRTQFGTVAQVVTDLGAVLYHVYVRRGKPRRRASTKRDCEELEVRFNKGKAQSTSAPQGYFVSTIRSIRRLSQTDPTAVDQACGMYAAAAALFAYSGVSFGVSSRILPIAKGLIRNVRDELGYRTMQFLHHYLVGNWDDEYEIGDALLEEGLRYGVFWEVNTYLGLNCERKIHQGHFVSAQEHIGRIARIGDVYGYDFVRTNQHAETAFLLLQQRRLPEALQALELYQGVSNEEALNLLALGTRAKIGALTEDRSAATAAAEEAAEIGRRLGRQVAPYHLSVYLMSRLLLDVTALETSLAGGDRAEVKRSGASAQQSSKTARWVAAKVARERPEAYRLTGRVCWLLGDQKQALHWWEKALREGERLGARPEIARVCMEIGHRLSAAGSKYSALGGIRATGFLERARRMFVEMALDSDLAQLDALTARAA
jgi:class 3 adenylate cyclase/tetratricopeptide (TPR) repeat protein